MRKLLYPITFLMAFFCLSLGQVQAKEAPDVLLKRLTQEMITALRQQDKVLKDNPNHIYSIVDKILVPYIDWHTMAQWVIGRNAWNKATASERDRFSNEFKDLLIRTYASTLRAYNNQTIEYLPIRGGAQGKDKVQVSSRIIESGKEPIRVTYRLVDKGNSWKVYDISIEGISLLKGFQSQFETDLQQNGLEALINKLHHHNEKPLR
jgi:phospholipid transport system substrate-binding protein